MSWLTRMVLPQTDPEIERLQSEIEARDRSIEAITPIAEEAIRRTDDVYYQLRAKVRIAARRLDRTTELLAHDLDKENS